MGRTPTQGDGSLISHPPRSGKQNSIGYYLWPAGRYLSRMAKFQPDLVADIMAKFPATDNPFVVQDILTAAASMPPASAVKLADAVARTALSGGFVGMDRAGEVASNLAQAGQLEASLKILRSLLEVVPDPRPNDDIGPSGREYRHEARTRIRGFDYGNILRTYARSSDSFSGFALPRTIVEKSWCLLFSRVSARP